MRSYYYVYTIFFIMVTVITSAAINTVSASETFYNTDVLVIGAGTGGVGAAIGAARLGATVALIEETSWLGGQNTAAGVAGFDGNLNNLSTGIYAEYKQRIRLHYGSGFRSNCTVSDLCFEPKVAATVLDTWIAEYPQVQVFKNTKLVSVKKEGQRVTGAILRKPDNTLLNVQAAVTIDGTEWGDVLAAAGVPFRLGRDSSADTLEVWAPQEPDPFVQDITYVVILKNYGANANKTIAKPAGYRKEEFTCSVATACPPGAWDMSAWRPVFTEKEFFAYGRLPNGKYMINWPIHAANIEVDLSFYDPAQRQKATEAARQKALRFIYFIQTELGYKNLGLADDEYPTADRLPFYPYVRESRRMVGVVTLTANDVLTPFARYDHPVYQHSVAVISYWFDHHHTFRPPGFERYPGRPPAFGIPLESYIARDVDGFMAVDKNISVSHMVNGATRLAPVAFSGGAAAGVTAALATRYRLQPRQIPVRVVQDILINWGSSLLPFQDIPTTHPYFKSIQRVALAGVMVGKWPSDIEKAKLPIFDPNENVSVGQGAIYLARALGLLPVSTGDDCLEDNPWPYLTPYGIKKVDLSAPLSGEVFISWLERVPTSLQANTEARNYELTALAKIQVLTKSRLAASIDRCLDPFRLLPVLPIN